MAEGLEAAPEKVGDALGHKLGPLPVWAWGGIIIVAAGAAYFLIIAPAQAASSGGASANGSPILPQLGGYNAQAGGGSTSATTTTPTTATAQQIQTALSGAATALQLPAGVINTYWQEYLSGQQPVGSSQATGDFNNVVNYLLNQLGTGAPTPAASAGLNANPFTNNTSWLNAILSALPTSTSAADQQNIVNLINGTTTTLSATAQSALNSAIGLVGEAPNPLSYTVSGAAPTGSTAVTLTQSLINSWDNAYFSLAPSVQNFGSWVNAAPSVVTSNVNTAQLQQIYTYFNSTAGKAAVAAAGGPVGWWNAYLANPSAVPISVPAASVALPTLTSAVVKK